MSVKQADKIKQPRTVPTTLTNDMQFQTSDITTTWTEPTKRFLIHVEVPCFNALDEENKQRVTAELQARFEAAYASDSECPVVVTEAGVKATVLELPGEEFGDEEYDDDEPEDEDEGDEDDA